MRRKIKQSVPLQGNVQAKNYKKIASNEVSTCIGYCCEILQLCDVCKGGLEGVDGIEIHQYLRNICRNRSPEKFQFCNF